MSLELVQSDIKIHIEQCIELIASQNKNDLKSLHISAKHSIDAKPLAKAREKYMLYKKYFLEPELLSLKNIKPVLINVETASEWADIFTIVRRTWSMPFNKGFGRRLRYVVFDTHHEAVMGIIGLQSPPVDLECRDRLFNYPKNRKTELINQTMDIYSLGSFPPYSNVLGGKLVAGLAASQTIVSDYKQKYANKKTLMQNRLIDNSLVALTTTSAFGRSSIYNRLKFKDRLLAKPIGYTKGYGSIHIEAVYPELVKVLKDNDCYHKGGYGNGPKQRWQNITRALGILGIPPKYAKHGIQREVFLYSLVEQLEMGMQGKEFGESCAIDPNDYSQYWLERWALPRAQRNPDWINQSTAAYIKSSLSLSDI